MGCLSQRLAPDESHAHPPTVKEAKQLVGSNWGTVCLAHGGFDMSSGGSRADSLFSCQLTSLSPELLSLQLCKFQYLHKDVPF